MKHKSGMDTLKAYSGFLFVIIFTFLLPLIFLVLFIWSFLSDFLVALKDSLKTTFIKLKVFLNGYVKMATFQTLIVCYGHSKANRIVIYNDYLDRRKNLRLKNGFREFIRLGKGRRERYRQLINESKKTKI